MPRRRRTEGPGPGAHLARGALTALWLFAADDREARPRSPTCDSYLGNVELRQACVIGVVLHYDNAASATALCDGLPAPRNLACRARWVEMALDGPLHSRAELVEACGGSPDCGFQIIDRRPEGSYVDQVRECIARTGPYADDCAGHAAQRLLVSEPGDAALREAALGPRPEHLLSLLPGYLRDHHREDCPDLGEQTPACRAGMGVALAPR